MYSTFVVVPAYGRKLDTKTAVKLSWETGDDFRVILGPQCGQYINIRDFSAYAEWGDTVVYSTDRFEIKLDTK